jgi:hypothetical protein
MYAIAFFLLLAIVLIWRERALHRACGFIGSEGLNGRRMICLLQQSHCGPHLIRWEAAPRCTVHALTPQRYDVSPSAPERRAA